MRGCATDAVVDMLLDQEGLEVDPLDRLEGDTPLHKAVRFVNGLPSGDWEDAKAMAELLLDAGADPRSVSIAVALAGDCCGGWLMAPRERALLTLSRRRIRNKAKLKPFELVDPRNTELRSILRNAEFAMMAGDDVVDNEQEEQGPTGSASDSE